MQLSAVCGVRGSDRTTPDSSTHCNTLRHAHRTGAWAMAAPRRPDDRSAERRDPIRSRFEPPCTDPNCER
eukprot:140534-Prymnesium_polylepis.2